MTQMLFANWSICTSPVWTIILLLLSYGHAETFDFTKCDITDNFKSEFVSASFKSLDAGRGCETNATSSSGQEVHVIVVKPLVSSNERWITVKLNIHSRRQANLDESEGANFQEEPRPVIFVLHSSLPVTWKVEMYGINSQQKHLFVLSKESSIRFQRKRTRLMAKTQKKALPFSAANDTIYQWTQKRFGAVTSYNEISELSVKFFIGRDVTASVNCDLNTLRPSLRIFSYVETVRPIVGCVSKRRNRHVHAKPVYIIELLEPPAPSPGMIGIDLEILPYYNGQSMRSKNLNSDNEHNWHFYLVVKSPPSLRWTLHSKEISGWVDIVADANADVKVTGVKISTVALRADDIKVTGRQLVDWSQDYIAPVQMYAGIHAANTIKLRVPPLEKNMASTRERETSGNQNGRAPKMSREGGHEYEKVDKQHHQENPDSWLQITCTDQEMEVAISKKFLQMNGLAETKITLKDPSCQPSVKTDEHIIFCTDLMHCGTHSQSLGNITSFTNAVMIEASSSLLNSLMPHELGSGSHEDDTSSGSRDLSMIMDDEDFQLNPVSIPVECKLPTANQSSQDSKNTSDSSHYRCRQREPQSTVQCNISLYTSSSFLQSVVEFPVTIPKNSTVYVKGVTDQDITLLVDSCWFSTSSEPNDLKAVVKMIVSQGCKKDDFLSWMDDPLDAVDETNRQYTKFGVKVTDIFKGHSSLYLHCQFLTCQREHNTQTHKCPIDGNIQCQHLVPQVAHSMHRGPLSSSHCGPLSLGPLDLTDREAFENSHSDSLAGSGTKSDSTQEVTNLGQERVIIEGLDSATVVGIAFAAFVIGILLMGSLWFIHSHTGPNKRAAAAPREPEADSDMTPNSSTPMTA